MPARALPAAPPPPSLDDLILSAERGYQSRQPPPRYREPERAPIPRAPRPAIPDLDTFPVALVLPILITTCTCGHVTRSVGASLLARYDRLNPRTRSLDCRRATDADMSLPRETKELAVSVPLCEKCF